MQNLAYNLDPLADSDTNGSDRCAACGEELFGPDAHACSWQAWGTFWEVFGMSNVELVCGNCGEYLQNFFAKRK